jgi:hypothetical protein
MDSFKITNETIAIVGIVLIAIVSVFAIPEAAENVVLALGGGVVGYLAGKTD